MAGMEEDPLSLGSMGERTEISCCDVLVPERLIMIHSTTLLDISSSSRQCFDSEWHSCNLSVK